uniref:RING-type domain-containing protein n=1 Tax=Globodera rostochiensis TaxID=31243 RepID=A0A914H4F0_GLORO
MLCNVCWDEVPTEHLCFCDCSMVPKSESDGSGVNDNDSNRTVPMITKVPTSRSMPSVRNVWCSTRRQHTKKCHSQSLDLGCVACCHKCNCTVGMDVPPEQEQKFCCPKCNCAFCRKCDEEWKEEHNELSCEQFAKQQQQKSDRRQLLLYRTHRDSRFKSW